MRTVLSIALRSPHELEHSRQPEAALACERGGIQQCTLFVTRAGKADADLMAAENRVLASRRRMLLVEDLALPPAVLRGVGADIVERRIAAEDAAVIKQHHAGQASI